MRMNMHHYRRAVLPRPDAPRHVPACWNGPNHKTPEMSRRDRAASRRSGVMAGGPPVRSGGAQLGRTTIRFAAVRREIEPARRLFCRAPHASIGRANGEIDSGALLWHLGLQQVRTRSAIMRLDPALEKPRRTERWTLSCCTLSRSIRAKPA